MTNLIPFPIKPVRSIKVMPHSADGNYCWARYEGDEWTGEIRFEPPMQVPLLLRRLRECEEARGLPIVLLPGVKAKVAA